jgi:hypothetical protein
MIKFKDTNELGCVFFIMLKKYQNFEFKGIYFISFAIKQHQH